MQRNHEFFLRDFIHIMKLYQYFDNHNSIGNLPGPRYSIITYERSLKALTYDQVNNLRSLICWPIIKKFTQLLANRDAPPNAHRDALKTEILK